MSELMNGRSQILTPAYGRDYKTPEAMQEDFDNGKDFILHWMQSPWDGKYCSKRDFSIGSKVKGRFNRHQDITFLVVK